MTAPPAMGAQGPARPRVFGTPGASLIGAGRALNAQRAHQGRLGEERLADLTRQIVDESPEMLLFHSVKLPSETGDIDQLLYAGGCFYLMDAKLWKGFIGERRVAYDIAMRDSETLVFVRDGQPFPGGEVKAPKQLALWRRYLVGHRVRAVVVLMDPGARVAPAASTPDVLVLNALDLQGWLRSIPDSGQPPLSDVWIRELAGLTFDPARIKERPRPQHGGSPSLRQASTPRAGSHRRGAFVEPPEPVRRMQPAHLAPNGALLGADSVHVRQRRVSTLGKRAMICVVLAWLSWILAMALPPASWLTLSMSLAFAIAAIAVGVRGRRLARSVYGNFKSAGWGIGLGITHLVLGFAVPMLGSLVFMLLVRR